MCVFACDVSVCTYERAVTLKLVSLRTCVCVRLSANSWRDDFVCCTNVCSAVSDIDVSLSVL